MSDLMKLLFDHYTAQFPKVKQKPHAEHEKYKLLKTIAGADDSDYCFTAGVKTGFALAVELLISD